MNDYHISMDMDGSTDIPERKRGFATLDKETRSGIARMGGKAAHMKGTAHRFTATEAREAGRKGGLAVSRNRSHMSSIGRKGGLR